MSSMRSALEEFEAEDVAGLADATLEGDLAELARASACIDVERSRRIAEIERRGSFRRDGALSITSWIAHRENLASGAAAHLVRHARFLRDVPSVARAFAAGKISPSGVELLASARATDAEAFEGSKEILVRAACALSIRQLAQAVAHWRRLVEAERDTDRRFVTRSLHVSPTLGGMVRVDGDLGPETGQQLITALRSLTDVWAREPEDDRTAVQRRVDALGRDLPRVPR
jgi:hypothetical protein